MIFRTDSLFISLTVLMILIYACIAKIVFNRFFKEQSSFVIERGRAAWSARWAHNPEVGGSNPLPAKLLPPQTGIRALKSLIKISGILRIPRIVKTIRQETINTDRLLFFNGIS